MFSPNIPLILFSYFIFVFLSRLQCCRQTPSTYSGQLIGHLPYGQLDLEIIVIWPNTVTTSVHMTHGSIVLPYFWTVTIYLLVALTPLQMHGLLFITDLWACILMQIQSKCTVFGPFFLNFEISYSIRRNAKNGVCFVFAVAH